MFSLNSRQLPKKRTFTLISKTWCPNSDYDQLSDVFESSFSPAVGPNRPVVFPVVLNKSLSQSIIRTQRQICTAYYFIMMSNSLDSVFFVSNWWIDVGKHFNGSHYFVYQTVASCCQVQEEIIWKTRRERSENIFRLDLNKNYCIYIEVCFSRLIFLVTGRFS